MVPPLEEEEAEELGLEGEQVGAVIVVAASEEALLVGEASPSGQGHQGALQGPCHEVGCLGQDYNPPSGEWKRPQLHSLAEVLRQPCLQNTLIEGNGE